MTAKQVRGRRKPVAAIDDQGVGPFPPAGGRQQNDVAAAAVPAVLPAEVHEETGRGVGGFTHAWSSRGPIRAGLFSGPGTSRTAPPPWPSGSGPGRWAGRRARRAVRGSAGGGRAPPPPSRRP